MVAARYPAAVLPVVLLAAAAVRLADSPLRPRPAAPGLPPPPGPLPPPGNLSGPPAAPAGRCGAGAGRRGAEWNSTLCSAGAACALRLHCGAAEGCAVQVQARASAGEGGAELGGVRVEGGERAPGPAVLTLLWRSVLWAHAAAGAVVVAAAGARGEAQLRARLLPGPTAWRRLLLGRQSAAVQRALSRAQFPPSCADRKFVVLSLPAWGWSGDVNSPATRERARSCGLGCYLKYFSAALDHAVGAGRTLLIDADGWTWARGSFCGGAGGWGCFFRNVSNCSLPAPGLVEPVGSLAEAKMQADKHGAQGRQRLRAQLRGLQGMPRYVSLTPDHYYWLEIGMPVCLAPAQHPILSKVKNVQGRDLAKRAAKMPKYPYVPVWWFGQLLAFLMRFTPRAERALLGGAGAAGEADGTVHMRRASHAKKGQAGCAVPSFAEYNAAAGDMCALHGGRCAALLQTEAAEWAEQAQGQDPARNRGLCYLATPYARATEAEGDRWSSTAQRGRSVTVDMSLEALHSLRQLAMGWGPAGGFAVGCSCSSWSDVVAGVALHHGADPSAFAFLPAWVWCGVVGPFATNIWMQSACDPSPHWGVCAELHAANLSGTAPWAEACRRSQGFGKAARLCGHDARLLQVLGTPCEPKRKRQSTTTPGRSRRR
eukprot:TRINITY_DN43162_c0_g1_i1.p1 TRINITY_DN43162_c0_g1~~TRINITY_DN43162_c0_g1_i1.p1  ORF type:complete len:655 (+),score=177.14 TRINITY_DN43162_c0_g1_i1:87-2051(+)